MDEPITNDQAVQYCKDLISYANGGIITEVYFDKERDTSIKVEYTISYQKSFISTEKIDALVSELDAQKQALLDLQKTVSQAELNNNVQ